MGVNEKEINTEKAFEREEATVEMGLSTEQVQKRIGAGAYNMQPQSSTRTVQQIVVKNVFTLFNLINLLLAIAIIFVGSLKDTLFFGIAISNTIIGIVQELRSKRKLDNLAILSQAKAVVVRDGRGKHIHPSEVVLDDIIYLEAGTQICADAVVVQSSGMEVDESLLTGEGNNIPKKPESMVMSGSFVTAGRAYVRVTAVGADNYATALTMEAQKEKTETSQIMNTLNNIVKVLTIVIIPIGIILFWRKFTDTGELQASVLGAAAAMIGMIPEGLVLLTSITLSVGAINLAKKKTLVQSLSSIETLARVDVLCLDKTGTITDGTLQFERIELQNDCSERQAEEAIAALMHALQDTNATAEVLKKQFTAVPNWQAEKLVPFSSRRKWSGAMFAAEGSFVIGAPAFMFPSSKEAFMQTATKYAKNGDRVLCLAHTINSIEDGVLPEDLECLALVILSDNIRPEAAETFRFFANEGVILKVISGDDPFAVGCIAARAGLDGAEHIVDMSHYGEEEDFTKLVEEYTVFGRVSPHQKRKLIYALKQNGHTVCMTGDGVNDVLAMKEADCSIAMINGSDAARGACDFVLMSSDFSSMISVLREGRRVINNIENVASLYLVKTIYSTLLATMHIFLPFQYPFTPLQMTPINSLTVGIPSFLLALRANYRRPQGKLISNVLENSLPAALTVVINIIFVQLAGKAFALSALETSTMIVLLTGMVGFVVLYKISKPITTPLVAMMLSLMLAFVAIFILFGGVFGLGSLFVRNVFFYLPLAICSPQVFRMLNKCVRKVKKQIEKSKKRKG